MGFRDICSNCGKNDEKNQRCARCRKVCYCSRECQVAHWAHHKVMCNSIKKLNSKREKEKRRGSSWIYHTLSALGSSRVLTVTYMPCLERCNGLEILDYRIYCLSLSAHGWLLYLFSCPDNWSSSLCRAHLLVASLPKWVLSGCAACTSSPVRYFVKWVLQASDPNIGPVEEQCWGFSYHIPPRKYQFPFGFERWKLLERHYRKPAD